MGGVARKTKKEMKEKREHIADTSGVICSLPSYSFGCFSFSFGQPVAMDRSTAISRKP